MLIQFTIQNFLSFRDEITFSLIGVDSEKQHTDHLTKNATTEGHSLIPIAAIYGANAAGKSNFIKAISFVKKLVLEGTQSSQIIPVYPFKLDNYYQKPSKFELIFTYQDIQYSYGFRLNSKQIIEEWLYGTPLAQEEEIMYFERETETSKDQQTTVEYGLFFQENNKDRLPFLNFIAEGTRPNQLLLTEAIDRNVKELLPVFNWFKTRLNVITAESDFAGLEIMIDNDEIFTDFLDQFLKSAGAGIDSIVTEKVELDFERHFPEIPKFIRDDIRQDLENLDHNSVIIVKNSEKRHLMLSKNEKNILFITDLKIKHRGENNNLVDFSLEEESDGTQRLINLIPSLFALQRDADQVVFIDELDRRLHPLLTQRFIEAFLRLRNPKNQLIFTTHDTNLLDLQLLRRDEIWFVEKNHQGVSTAYSLVEFKMRSDLKIEKGYLNGRFGSIPFFGDLESLGWTKN